MTPLKFSNLVILTIVGLCFLQASCEVAKKPVIGIISTPSDMHDLYDPEEFSYVKGSYTEFVEAGDGIPIAIPWDLPEKELLRVLDSVNGILFTGGDASLWEFDTDINDMVFSNFTKRTTFILRYALHLNNKGIHYPVYGICQGHEVISLGLVNKVNIIDHFRHPGQLDYVEIIEAGRDSRMFGGIQDHLTAHMLQTKNVYYNHRYGFNMSLLEDSNALNNFFIITAKGTDDDGKEFIAAMEAKKYPIYTVQYHPERVLSEWKNKTQFHHPDEAAHASIEQAKFFVNEARKNDQSFYSEESLARFLVTNHESVYYNATWPQTFFYDKKSPISYHVNPDWSDYSDVDDYDCVHHDCSFIGEL